MNEAGLAKVSDVVLKFKKFYIQRKNAGYIADSDVDARIANIENSSINDVWTVIKNQPLKVIREKGFLNVIKKSDDQLYFQLPHKITQELNVEDIAEIKRIIDGKLKLYFSKIDTLVVDSTAMIPIKEKSEPEPAANVLVKQLEKKTITPLEKLGKRILKEFEKKKFIGDIIINEAEFEILIDYFRTKCNGIINSYTNTINDPIFATALVQIGIKYYDGNFWGHVAEVLGTNKINPVHQGFIGEAFVKTLAHYNKLLLDKSERVNNILMHGFVSDYYANEMFDFLFKYYNIDLERDLQRNNSEMMQNLIEVTQRNDNTGRTYLLVKQTANAISANIRSGKIRLRRLLRLIDKCFWEQITPANPVSRLSILFNNWQENSNEFKLQYNKYHSGTTYGGGKKSYSSPYLKCDLLNIRFVLVLPTQLIKFEFDKNVKWNIISNTQCSTISTSLYQAVTGYKTETEELNIKSEDIFNDFTIELCCNDNRIRLFKIKADCIRFFDKDGDYINSDNSLPRGEVYAFTKKNETPRSEALIENELIGSLVRSSFEFEYGDIIRLPDGKPISIGKKIEEGLLHRKVLNGAYAVNEGTAIPIYYSSPTVLLKIQAKRANGTVIEINGTRHRLFDKETTVVELEDRSGETGYILNLGDYGCVQDGIYTVYIDVPNDRTNRLWQFALINGINYEYEDAPYIFKSKGTIRFNEGLDIRSQGNIDEKNSDANSFNFFIQPDIDHLQFLYYSGVSVIELYFEIPALKWKFGSGQWNVEKPSDIWHSNFPTLISIKYSDDKIRISMDEQIDDDNNSEDYSVTYLKSKAKGFFECDTTRFKSWFGREKVARSIFIDLLKNRTEFIKVITRSVVVTQILKGDFKSERLIGEFDIIGFSSYYADVVLLETNEIVADKVPLNDGIFEIKCKLSSGMYKVTIFEDEEDDTGFGVSNFLPVGEYNHNLINPYDLQGKSISLKYIKKGIESLFQIQLSCQYVVCGLTRIDANDNQNYFGKLLIKTSHGSSPIAYDINVNFFDLNKLQYVYLTYYDGYDFVEFLYDTNRKIIVKEEEKGLSRAIRYRRYDSIFPEDYLYVVEFTDEIPSSVQIQTPETIQHLDNQIVWKQKDNKDDDIAIEKMGLSVRTYNCLHRAGIRTAKSIQKCGTQALTKVRNLGRRGLNEVIYKMRDLGFVIEDINTIEKTITKLETTEQSTNTINKQNDHINQNANKQLKHPNITLSEIGLSIAVLNCLKKANVLTIKDILDNGKQGLYKIKGFNSNMYKEIVDKLNSKGVSI